MRHPSPAALTPERIDSIVEAHYRHKAEDDIEAVVAGLTEDADHLAVPSPVGPLQGRQAAAEFYTMLFSSIRGEGVTPLRRLYGDRFVVDEVLWRGRVEDGRPFLCEGRSGPVEFRMLHVFEFEGDLIKNEQVWCDLAAIQRQLGAGR